MLFLVCSFYPVFLNRVHTIVHATDPLSYLVTHHFRYFPVMSIVQCIHFISDCCTIPYLLETHL